MSTVAHSPASSALRSAAWHSLLGAGAACAVMGLVMRFDAPAVLAAMVFIAAAVAMLIRPDLATLLVVLLLYINVPAILTQRHGLSEAVAGSFILLLGAPLLHALVVQRTRLKADATFFLMLGLFGALLLSSLGAVDRSIAFLRVQGFVMEGLLLYWLVVNVIRDEPTLRRVIAVLLFAGSLVSGLSLYQDVTGDYRQEFGGLAYRDYVEEEDTLPTAEPESRRKWDRAQGPVNEPNRFAQIMIVLLPLAVFMVRTAQSKAARLCSAVAGILILVGVLITLSRGAMVTLALMAMAMVFLRWITPSRVLVGVLTLAAAMPVVAPFFIGRVQSITDVTYLLSDDRSQIREADGAIRGRMTEMLAALYVFFDHPVVGVGPGQFSPFYFERYGQISDINFRDVQRPRRAHTLYFELAAELGIVGLTMFLAIAGLLLRRLWCLRCYWLHRRPDSSDLAAALVLTLLAYLTTAIFLHLSYQRYYWILVAAASVTVHLLEAKRTAGDAPLEPTAAPRGWSVR